MRLRVVKSLAARRRRAVQAGVALLGLLAVCAGPDFTERRALDDPVMTFRDDPTRAHFRAKARDSREGGAGDFGAAAGGGCGCY